MNFALSFEVTRKSFTSELTKMALSMSKFYFNDLLGVGAVSLNRGSNVLGGAVLNDTHDLGHVPLHIDGRVHWHSNQASTKATKADLRVHECVKMKM